MSSQTKGVVGGSLSCCLPERRERFVAMTFERLDTAVGDRICEAASAHLMRTSLSITSRLYGTAGTSRCARSGNSPEPPPSYVQLVVDEVEILTLDHMEMKSQVGELVMSFIVRFWLTISQQFTSPMRAKSFLNCHVTFTAETSAGQRGWVEFLGLSLRATKKGPRHTKWTRAKLLTERPELIAAVSRLWFSQAIPVKGQSLIAVDACNRLDAGELTCRTEPESKCLAEQPVPRD